MVALDDALVNLAAVDKRKSQVVELRFFGGLSIDETAEVLKVSPGTVMRDWTLAKAWLLREVTGDTRRMNPERWQQIDQLFHSALERNGGERLGLSCPSLYRGRAAAPGSRIPPLISRSRDKLY